METTKYGIQSYRKSNQNLCKRCFNKHKTPEKFRKIITIKTNLKKIRECSRCHQMNYSKITTRQLVRLLENDYDITMDIEISGYPKNDERNKKLVTGNKINSDESSSDSWNSGDFIEQILSDKNLDNPETQQIMTDLSNCCSQPDTLNISNTYGNTPHDTDYLDELDDILAQIL